MTDKKKKDRKDGFDKNLFRAMNYEYAGEMGIVDNEEMKNNSGLNPTKKKKEDEKNPGRRS